MKEFILKFFLELIQTTQEMSPYLIFGFFMAGILSVFINPETVENHLGGKGLLQVVKASLFGVPLPLCSCGVIPVAASLRRHGAGKGATTSFLISTPQTGVDSIFITLSLLGPVYAIFRPLVAFASGIVGGMAVNLFDDDDSGRSGPAGCGDYCCTTDNVGKKITEVFRYGFRTLPADIGKALIFGILVAAVIGAVIPDDFLVGILGGGIIAMLVMMALGIPVYVCATASVPIAAALIAKGVSPGAALVFLMTGPATNAATIMTVSRVMGKMTMGIYLATVAVSAVVAGLLLDLIYHSPAVSPAGVMPFMIPVWIKSVSAVILAGIIAASFISRKKGESEKMIMPESGESVVTVSIKGMTCEHCVKSVERSLRETPGVETVEVDLKKGEARIRGRELDEIQLAGSVEVLGYKVTGTQSKGLDK